MVHEKIRMKTRFFIVMGVSGCGKSSVGRALAERLGWDFYDADDFHLPASVAKMAGGIPLDDSDRAPWLASLHDLISSSLKADKPAVLACSALKERYRRQLLKDNHDVQVVYLKGNYDLVWSRMQVRSGHYMKPHMLKSQFDALEEPQNAITIDISNSVEQIIGWLCKGVSMSYKIGILGLGVMGRSLALNLHRNGIPVIGYDPTPRLPADSPLTVSASVVELVSALETPRMLLLMVPAGEAVDAAIASLKPHLQQGDIIIDGGNSFFMDTGRRVKSLGADGISFIGMGVSGGESGALWGPSMMPGGAESAWAHVQPIIQAIAARAADGTPCAAWMGRDGSGHYVKMVHNGIEYGDMQLIAEIYDLLHRGAGLSNGEIAAIFAEWNEGELRSYLIEITAQILRRQDEGADLVDAIVDEAAQKGTGKWASQNAFDIGAPIPTINAAVEGRILSSLKKERVAAAQVLGGTDRFEGDPDRLARMAGQALFAGKVTSYSQGFAMLRLASQEYGWSLDLASIARVWRAGCIIRAGLLDNVAAAFENAPVLSNLLMDSMFGAAVAERQSAWREVVKTAIDLGIPMMALSASLAYFDAYRSERLPANLTQAQRDFFGAHTYRRVDKEGSFHTDWE